MEKDQKKIIRKIIRIEIIIILIPLMLLFITSCTSVIKSSSEFKSYQKKIYFDKKLNLHIMEISGFMTDSALWIKSYKIEYEKEKIIITITKDLKQTNNSGPYFIQFIITDSVNYVFLGNEIIWKR
jgi:hypothetical protein